MFVQSKAQSYSVRAALMCSFGHLTAMQAAHEVYPDHELAAGRFVPVSLVSRVLPSNHVRNLVM